MGAHLPLFPMPASVDDVAPLPSTAGTYLLILRLEAPTWFSVGRLGEIRLGAGLYAYVGSARGPGGLRARIRRHLRPDKRPHWHIDALTAHTPVVAVWWVEAHERLECTWAQTLAALPQVGVPMAGFGASDCACRSHLFNVPAAQLDAVWEALGQPLRLVVG